MPNLKPESTGPTMQRYLYGDGPFVPQSITDAGAGLRPAFERLLEMIDTTDEAWPMTAGLLREMMLAEAEITEAVLMAAIKVGRRRWQQQANTALPAPRHERLALAAAGAIVYYIRRGNLIKIGTTTEPAQRFTELLPDEILAFEPGGYADEACRHRQFTHLRRRGEYFESAPELLLHIQQIRDLYGDPDPSWRTSATLKVGNRNFMPQGSGPSITSSDAIAALGIRPGTLAGWVHRGKVAPVGRDERNRQLYYVNQLVALRDNPRAQPYRADLRLA